MDIDIYRALYDMERLISEAKLSEIERRKHNLNLQAIKKVVIEWEQNNAEKNK